MIAGELHRRLAARHRIVAAVRSFFDRRGYLEVATPVLVPSPGIDAYIDALATTDGGYLAPSPELQMKRLLGDAGGRIYQIMPVCRADECGRLHNPEFQMLEWYRTGAAYLDILTEFEQLLAVLAALDETRSDLPVRLPRVTVEELYARHAGWNPVRAWDEDRYFRDWVERIDPYLATLPAVAVLDFPEPLAALSAVSANDPAVCERFEIFIDGVEIGNAYTELTDAATHRRRFARSNAQRRRQGRLCYPVDRRFMQMLDRGMPACGGMAVGVDRLVMVLLGAESVAAVMTFPHTRW